MPSPSESRLPSQPARTLLSGPPGPASRPPPRDAVHAPAERAKSTASRLRAINHSLAGGSPARGVRSSVQVLHRRVGERPESFLTSPPYRPARSPGLGAWGLSLRPEAAREGTLSDPANDRR